MQCELTALQQGCGWGAVQRRGEQLVQPRPDDVGLAAPQQAAERGVGLQHPPVAADERDPAGRVAERRRERLAVGALGEVPRAGRRDDIAHVVAPLIVLRSRARRPVGAPPTGLVDAGGGGVVRGVMEGDRGSVGLR